MSRKVVRSLVDRQPQVRYAQCWEDPQILSDGLRIGPHDDVLSVASGGDNTFALLLQNPRSLYAIDRNPAQLYLMELKIRALQILEYDDFVKFLGARPSATRGRHYAHLRPSLTDGARGYWDSHQDEVKSGVIHSGKFERYFHLFRRVVLPPIHRQASIEALFDSRSIDQQQVFYDSVWNNRRWRALFRIFFGRFLLGYVGRDPATFRYVDIESVAEELLSRTERGFTGVPTYDNYFLEYILTGAYRNLEQAHPYLKACNFNFLKEHVEQIQLIQTDLQEFLTRMAAESISKVNASDVFEYMSQTEFEQVLGAVLRACREGASIAFWTLFIPRRVPESLRERISVVREDPCLRSNCARTFFYDSFSVWKMGLPVERLDFTGTLTEAKRWQPTA